MQTKCGTHPMPGSQGHSQEMCWPRDPSLFLSRVSALGPSLLSLPAQVGPGRGVGVDLRHSLPPHIHS